MAKVTSKRQITIPKALADRFHIREGDEVQFVETSDAIRLVPAVDVRSPLTVAERLSLYDAATRRQAARQRGGRARRQDQESRGWSREDLYDGDSAR